MIETCAVLMLVERLQGRSTCIVGTYMYKLCRAIVCFIYNCSSSWQNTEQADLSVISIWPFSYWIFIKFCSTKFPENVKVNSVHVCVASLAVSDLKKSSVIKSPTKSKRRNNSWRNFVLIEKLIKGHSPNTWCTRLLILCILLLTTSSGFFSR